MNKKELLELLNSIETKKVEVKNLANAGKLEEAKKAKEKLKTMQEKMDLLKDIEPAEDIENHATPVPGANCAGAKDPVKDFADAARHGFRNYNNEGTGADGGYTVPQDIQTQVNTLREAQFSLASLVSTENVSTSSGRRTYKTRAQHTGFAKVGEGGKIGKKDGPQFSVVNYTISKYAGYLPVTNELLSDSDQAITSMLTQWLADEDLATRNSIVLAAIAKATEVDLKNLDGIKKAVNVTLGSKFSGLIKIVTNDDGLQYLDTLKDSSGRYLLSANANAADPIKNVLAVGTGNIPVVVIPNEVLASTAADTAKKIPFKIGSLADYARIFDRQQMSIAVSNEAAVTDFNAFEQDMTLFRAIDRLDCEVLDDKAIVNGYISVSGE